jgi:subtilisin-like proprotein convertase family protein
MTRTTRKQLRQVMTATALMALAFAPAAFADLAVQHDSSTFTETAGNGNGIVEPGDTVAVTENVVSFDDAVLTGVSGTLSSSSPDVTVSSATSPYADLLFGMATPNTNAYSVKLSNTMECGVNVPLNVALTASSGSGDIPFSMPTGNAGAWAAADSTDVPRAIPDDYSTGITSTLGVGGSSRVKGLRVRIGKIAHSYAGDLTITLIAPNGQSVRLINANLGGNGADFTNTVFDDSAATSITKGAPPFTGSYRPVEPLSSLDGAPLNGNWTLQVSDNAPGNIGEIDAWGIDAAPAVCAPQPTGDPSPPPPPPPPPPHDCGNHNGTGGNAKATANVNSGKANANSGKGNDKPCKN